MSFRKVGVLGGMGPQATVLLQQRLIDSISAQDDASHLPLVIDMNPQVPSRIDWLLNQKGENPALVLAAMAQRLQQAGAQALAMPCNTAHLFAAEISAHVEIPLLNMLALSAERASFNCQSNPAVGILASTAARDMGLFDRALLPHNSRAIWPDPTIDLLGSIVNIKANGVSSAEIKCLQSAVDNCVEQGASCILIGCTEFSLISRELNSHVPIVDSLDILVSAIIEFAQA